MLTLGSSVASERDQPLIPETAFAQVEDSSYVISMQVNTTRKPLAPV
jgi:hypothetical protein